MVNIYKNRGKGGNGEFVIETNLTSLDTFKSELSGAILAAISELEGDDEFTMTGILEKAFPIAFKLSGYKAESVHEQKILLCGHSSPSECDLIAGID